MRFASINRLTLAATLVVALAFTGTVRAQAPAPTPGAVALAKELVVLKGGAAMFDPLIPGVVEQVKNNFVPTNPQLTRPLNDVAAQLKKEYEGKRADVVNEVARIYAQHFSEAELKEILAFYKSPVGRKMITEEPRAIDESLKAAQAWAVKFSDVVMERFRVEMKKKGYDL